MQRGCEDIRLSLNNIPADISFCRCGYNLKRVNYHQEIIQQTKTEEIEMNKAMNVVFKGIAVAMGIAVVVMGTLGTLNAATSSILLGIGLSALAIDALRK
jgi:hypothetical protein